MLFSRLLKGWLKRTVRSTERSDESAPVVTAPVSAALFQRYARKLLAGASTAWKPLREPFASKRMVRDPRTILGPAVRFSDLGVVALPAPATHDDVLRMVVEQGGSRAGKHKGANGFVTADGRFVLPREAMILARSAGQVPQRGSSSSELQCRDLDEGPETPGPNGSGFGGP